MGLEQIFQVRSTSPRQKEFSEIGQPQIFEDLLRSGCPRRFLFQKKQGSCSNIAAATFEVSLETREHRRVVDVLCKGLVSLSFRWFGVDREDGVRGFTGRTPFGPLALGVRRRDFGLGVNEHIRHVDPS